MSVGDWYITALVCIISRRDSISRTNTLYSRDPLFGLYPVADKIMNLTPPTLASQTSLNERNRPAYSTRVNLDIVDGSIREVVAPGEFFVFKLSISVSVLFTFLHFCYPNPRMTKRKL